jgi:hypothetical protein
MAAHSPVALLTNGIPTGEIRADVTFHSRARIAKRECLDTGIHLKAGWPTESGVDR